MKKLLSYTSLAIAGLGLLSACSVGDCDTPTPGPSPTPGNISLAIAAPPQYPAGVEVTVPITMTNTSANDAKNLVYTVPAPGTSGNTTGVSINVLPNGLGENCQNIKSGATCKFTAVIPAGSVPGSFTVVATPATNVTQSKSVNSKSLQAGGISVQTDLGLVNTPNTQNEYYILPVNQTVAVDPAKATQVYVSVWIKKATTAITSLDLVDNNGNPLTAEPALPEQSFAQGSVVSYVVTVPAGVKLQNIQAFSAQCTTLNVGTNNNTACSNNAVVRLEDKSKGVLSIQPNYFNMDGSYPSQVITLVNVGNGTISDLTIPTTASLPSEFSVSDISCNATNGTLASGQSCQIKINYTANAEYGVVYPEFTYKNATDAVDTLKSKVTIPYSDINNTPYSLLTVAPSDLLLTPTESTGVITYTNTPGGNTVGATLTISQLPTLSSPLESGTTTLIPLCTTGMQLAVNQSCYFPVKYSSASVDGLNTLQLNYTNGSSNNPQAVTSNVVWKASTTTPTGLLIATPDPVDLTVSNPRQVITLTNTGTGTVSNLTLPTTPLTAPLQFESTDCGSTLAANGGSCIYTIKYESSLTASSAILTFTYDNGVATGLQEYVTVNWVVRVATTCNGACRIFVSQSTFTGDLKSSANNLGGNVSTGFAGADYLCQIDANNPVAGSTYWKALLLNNNSTIVGTTYYKLDRTTQIATAANGNLVWGAGALINSIGTPSGSSQDVWTGGWGSGYTCSDWTTTSGSGSTGDAATGSDPNWFQYNFPTCDGSGPIGNLALYCVEQFHF